MQNSVIVEVDRYSSQEQRRDVFVVKNPNEESYKEYIVAYIEVLNVWIYYRYEDGAYINV